MEPVQYSVLPTHGGERVTTPNVTQCHCNTVRHRGHGKRASATHARRRTLHMNSERQQQTPIKVQAPQHEHESDQPAEHKRPSAWHASLQVAGATARALRQMLAADWCYHVRWTVSPLRGRPLASVCFYGRVVQRDAFFVRVVCDEVLADSRGAVRLRKDARADVPLDRVAL